MDVGLAFRVLVGAVLTVAPTILFLGLWRGLMALRDDDLVNRTMNGEFGTIPDSPISAIMFGSDAVGRERSPTTRRTVELVHCPRCDELNPTYANYCHECLQKLG
ncbi:hypothetical protein [Haladaptatus sp. NG-SE-30]